MSATSPHTSATAAPELSVEPMIAPMPSAEELFTRYALHYGVEALAHAKFADALLRKLESDREGAAQVLHDFNVRGKLLSFELAPALEGVEISAELVERGRHYLNGDTIDSRVQIASSDYINPLRLGDLHKGDHGQGEISPAFLQREWSIEDLQHRERVGAVLLLARELWKSCAQAIHSRCGDLSPSQNTLVDNGSKLIATLCEGEEREKSLRLGALYVQSIDAHWHEIRARELAKSVAALKLWEERRSEANASGPRPNVQPSQFIEETSSEPVVEAPETEIVISNADAAQFDHRAKIARFLKAARGLDPDAREEALREVENGLRDSPEENRKEWVAAAKVCKRIADDLGVLSEIADRLVDASSDVRQSCAHELRLFLKQQHSAGVKREAQNLLKECTYTAPERELVRTWTLEVEGETARDILLQGWRMGAYAIVGIGEKIYPSGYVLFGAMTSGVFLLIDPEMETSCEIHVDEVAEVTLFTDKE